MSQKVSSGFYLQDDVVKIARDMLGKFLYTNVDGLVTGGRIVETEAYNGRCDKACHAFLKRTKRTNIMYEEGGLAYIYLCYGIHHMLNIVTNIKGLADAVLIRALQPREGIPHMLKRRSLQNPERLTSGPGNLGKALGINKTMNGSSFTKGTVIWLEEGPSPREIIADRRVGVGYAENDASLPWRFFDKSSNYISRKPQKPLL